MKLLKIVLFIWQLPQNILGLIILKINKKHEKYMMIDDIEFYFLDKFFNSGISLGNKVLLDSIYKSYPNILINTNKHEFGHTKQSKILGPLYLIVVGITSLVFNNIWDRIFHKNWNNQKRNKWYYSRFPENWADKLGGVTRK